MMLMLRLTRFCSPGRDPTGHSQPKQQGSLPAPAYAAHVVTHDTQSSLNALSGLASTLGAKASAAAAAAVPSVASIFASGQQTTTSQPPPPPHGSVVRAGGGGGGGYRKPVMPKVLSGRLQLQSGLFGQLAERSFAVKPTDGTLKQYKVGVFKWLGVSWGGRGLDLPTYMYMNTCTHTI